MSETLHGPNKTHFSPANMAQIAMSKPLETRIATTPESQEKHTEANLPHEGKVIEIDGQKYSYEKVPTGTKKWDPETQQLEPAYHSLKTWFSHSTENIGPGPGWDSRFRLSDLTDQEMLNRYGHVFTHDEIISPSGKEDFATGERTGGMPDNVLYYDLSPFKED